MLDISNDCFPAPMDGDVFHGYFLLAFAAIPTQRFEVSREGSHHFYRHLKSSLGKFVVSVAVSLISEAYC